MKYASTKISEIEEVKKDDIVILFMGPTGSGKSTFIDLLTGRNRRAGKSLESNTTQIQAIRVHHPVHDDRVILVDTPPFNDIYRPDIETLDTIAHWFEKLYQNNVTLIRILYLHRITSKPAADPPLPLFRSLCGDDTLEHVTLVTTMWDDDTASAREREEQIKNMFWKPLSDKGARYDRLMAATQENAWKVVNQVINLGSKTLALPLQKDFVDHKLKLKNTPAKREVSRLKSILQDNELILEAKLQQLARINGTDTELRHGLIEEINELENAMRETVAQIKAHIKGSIPQRIRRFVSVKKAELVDQIRGHDHKPLLRRTPSTINLDGADRLQPPSQELHYNSDNTALRLRAWPPNREIDFGQTQDSTTHVQTMHVQNIHGIQSRNTSFTDISSTAFESSSQIQLGGRAPEFSFGNSIILENQWQNFNYYGASVLNHFTNHVMLGALFDSSERDPPPRCHPGTRLAILQSLQERVLSLDQTAGLMWLPGPAGAGKTSIMQTFAEMEAEHNMLAASLFLSRPNNRNDPQKIFTTISYQMAVNDDSYQEYLTQLVAADPAILDKSMEKQFNDLFVIPFAERSLLRAFRSRVIVIDGLDECDGMREQCRIIELIDNFVSEHPTVPLVWVIASRPEQHLTVVFSRIRTRLTSYWEREIPIDSDDGMRDVEAYLRRELTRIRNNHDISNMQWPSETQFLKISSAASGLFIVASTIIRILDDPGGGDPVSQLDRVVSVLEAGSSDATFNPFGMLDTLYKRTLSDIPSDMLDVAKLILGYLIVCQYVGDGMPASPFWICNILGIERHIFYGALQGLPSVLAIPESQNAASEDIHFLHKSFPDFLKDRRRSEVYFVNIDEVATNLWKRFVTILREWTTDHTYGSVKIYWQPEATADDPHPERTLVSIVGEHWPVILRFHLEGGPTKPFQLLLPTSVMIEQLQDLDLSYSEVLDPSQPDAIRLIKCLKNQEPVDLWSNVIRHLPSTFDYDSVEQSNSTGTEDG